MAHADAAVPTATIQSWNRDFALLSLAALGVVFGDIGTSPLYALRECFLGQHGVPATPANVLGVCSLIVWSLVLVIAIKYLVFVMRADNCGEGGILALMALVRGKSAPGTKETRRVLVALGLFGSALLYGDGVITPAISVLSAVEGVNVATTALQHIIVPLTVAILVGLFIIQPMGTARVGGLFGPVLALWFVTIAFLGAGSIVRHPAILGALNPEAAVRFFAANGGHGLLVMGAVVLCVTGGEALYADMGHFGRAPIRVMWFGLVMPALLLNYLGQGAALLGDPAAAESPFFRLAPSWALYPLVVLATVSTVIASQALVSASFSLTRQAMRLGYTPPVRVVHTSAREQGQIYIPAVNWTLMLGTIALVIGFRTSSNLASAYGVAVTMTMTITSVLFFMVARELWHWSLLHAGALAGAFLIIDLAFLGPNLLKIHTGGWVPLLIALVVFTLMTTWRTGRRLLAARLAKRAMPLAGLLRELAAGQIPRVAGTAVFFSAHPDAVPFALLQHLTHCRVLHERVIILTIRTRDVARTPAGDRLTFEPLGSGVYAVTDRHGFMEDVCVPDILAALAQYGLHIDPRTASYYVRHEIILPTEGRGMARWREMLYAWMARNAGTTMGLFELPPDRVLEIGTRVEI